MRTVLALTFGLAALLAAVKTDYNHSTDFAKYKTYSWLRVDAGNSLWQDRIQKDVDTELAAKGWQRVPSGGNASVAAVGSTKNEQQIQTFYDGFGGGWIWQGFGDGVATTQVQNIPVGDLMVDIFDSGTKKLIWRGTAEKTLSGDPEKNLQEAVADMFKHFPPPAKG
jgi:hypothetical protein